MEMLSHIYICRATRCCKVIQHHSAILISLVFDHLGNHQTMPAVQFWWLKSRLAVRPDGGGLPLGWPTIYRAGPGYLLGVPQMLHPEPKKRLSCFPGWCWRLQNDDKSMSGFGSTFLLGGSVFNHFSWPIASDWEFATTTLSWYHESPRPGPTKWCAFQNFQSTAERVLCHAVPRGPVVTWQTSHGSGRADEATGGAGTGPQARWWVRDLGWIRTSEASSIAPMGLGEPWWTGVPWWGKAQLLGVPTEKPCGKPGFDLPASPAWDLEWS